jgi:putative ABC transport system substrate-binding protein
MRSIQLGRREFITLIGGAAATWPLGARAQQPGRVPRIGVLTPYAEDDTHVQAEMAAFRQRLNELGWADGPEYVYRLQAR